MQPDQLKELYSHLSFLSSIEKKPTISLKAFVVKWWSTVEPAPFIDGWHIDAICEHLEAITNLYIRNLLINMPPRHAKSLIVSVFWPMWVWTFKPECKWIFASYAQPLSTRDSLRCRRLITHKKFVQEYGHICQLSQDQKQKQRFENTHLGYRIATSVDGIGTGEGGDVLVCDDPHNVREAESNTVRESTIIWWDETMSTRFNDPKTGCRVIVMQRAHELDLSGHVLEKGTYVHLMLPAEYEVHDKKKTILGWCDPREKEGELLCPERFGHKELDALKVELGTYGVAAQLQQRPIPRGGGIIKGEWWCYFVPAYGADHKITAPAFNYTLQSWDTAFKEGQDNDYSACTTWGVNNTGAYLINAFKGKMDFPALLVKVKELYDLYRPSKILVEDKASGQSLLQSLKRYSNFPIKAVKVSADKESRMHAVSPFIESGRVFLMKDANWLESYKTELETFPRAAHDDMVDSTTQALAEIFLKSASSFNSNINIMGR
ncbi:Archaeophage PsiM2, terminase large subunit [uncultured Caudovirales phage]|uniref:Archaeophage PsiM2, terminase large subunit n=1 Tax=uncultured Caudovirales phage TaxID=2100421 RepID=A0A6J5QPC6_9CAUD|nr:Archaeophage PsiM2, terminase large subunit [uncultured Caudovirales phage]CAB4183321.1 Archaeophage PsiM2, terminase large subunit [uncultured Caudovirales phage]CAB4213090.1 Archaeophage PsiM2, terminase large subunit [uncultured Caudovirales phage]